ncbi:MAG: ATP-dependent helicase [Candidatus Pacebacteria bacterium CG10_big_fil_rev_8_21_14_0_10_42_12]|nr:MAG: ATP-dependent helicase [Candidatus Pacebacteria bacterium CG10_big_fil_rev_8_21_14_0_10_42_12]
MRNFSRSFSNSNNRSGGGSSFRGNSRGGGYSRGGGGRGRGRRQASFDPSHVILQASLNKPEIKEEEVYVPKYSFSDFAIADDLKRNIADRGYTVPTPIQDQIIPSILEGRDAVGIANTGTGKTAAFLIPLLNKIITGADHEQVLIIVPTRELALQVRDELVSFTSGINIFSTLCIGGASLHRQVESLRRGQHFVIGTPGRIKDLNMRRKLRFEDFTNIVLDEVDRMLDMGFVNEVRAIIDQLPEERQSLFFSATMTSRVQEIMRGFLKNPVIVSVKTQDTAASVQQEIVKLHGRSKIEVLHDLLISEGFDKVLVFGRTKHGTEKLTRDLQQRGFKVDSIHGNKSQGQRQRALKDFKINRLQALIATDVVSRGVDIDNVSHVINYDLPESYEDYIHRIGRTGRADKLGTALTFVE